MTDHNNLLISLHGWAHRQDENFVTDSFAHLLRQLLEGDPTVGLDILARLTDDHFPPADVDVKMIRIRTQVTGQFGRPDLEIIYANHRILIEVKVDSGLGDDQLGRYLKILGLNTCNTTLILLSRHAVEVDSNIKDQVIAKRWFEVAHWLGEHIDAERIVHPINQFLVRQFAGFMEYRGMTIEKIGPELITGLAAIRNLAGMLELWMIDHQRTSAPSFGRNWSGFYTPRDTQNYFVGLYHDHPGVLVFETNKMPFNKDAASQLGIGRVLKASGLKWVNEFPLNDPDDNFFSLLREQQIAKLEQFLSASLEAAEKLRINANDST